jgi:hypothetical protein
MRNIIYYCVAFLFAFVSCEKDNLETESLEALQAGDELTKVDLAASKRSFTVEGQSNPSLDVPAVQQAVDNYDYVTLSGVFDFGSDEATGGIDITRENVVLQGPATILNGVKFQFIPELGEARTPINITAPGVQVRNIEFVCDFDGILINVEKDGKPVIIEGNTISSNLFGAGVAAKTTPGGIKVLNNNIESFINFYASETTGSTEIANNEMVAGYDCVFMFTFNNKLDIINNDMHVLDGGFESMFIGSWLVNSATGPEWGDNPPVRIIGNTIAVEGMDAAGIIVGTSASGINNVLVKDNTLTGTAGFSGLLKEPYGHNNKFINNDLSGLTTYSPQIWVMGGSDNHYQNNKLGRVDPSPWAGFFPAFQNAATLVTTINWHENDGLDTPDPLNHGNHFSNNDYTMTGVTGWSENPESIGAVLLLDFLQKFNADGSPFEEDFVMENFINEKRFTEGTDVCNQVLDLNPGANHIAGAKACEAQAKKADKQLVQKQQEVFGKRIMERHQKRAKILKEKKNIKF